LERSLERSYALQLDLNHAQLVLPALLVNRHLAANIDFPPVLQERTVHLQFAAEEHATDLRDRVLEREINMTRALLLEIGAFAGDPNRSDLRLEQAADLPGQFRDRKNFSKLFLRKKLSELPLRFRRLRHGASLRKLLTPAESSARGRSRNQSRLPRPGARF